MQVLRRTKHAASSDLGNLALVSFNNEFGRIIGDIDNWYKPSSFEIHAPLNHMPTVKRSLPTSVVHQLLTRNMKIDSTALCKVFGSMK